MKLPNHLTNNSRAKSPAKNELDEDGKKQRKPVKQTSLTRPTDAEKEMVEDKQIPIKDLNSENDI